MQSFSFNRLLSLLSHLIIISRILTSTHAQNTTTTTNKTTPSSTTPCSRRSPPIWPTQFIIIQRRIPSPSSSTKPATTVTYYDYTSGANLIQITRDHSLSSSSDEQQQPPVLWDLELNDGTSYYFYPSTRTCTKRTFPVGILRQDWLVDGAISLGESVGWNGRAVCGWTKADFVDYYADKETMEPVSWYFHNMKATFEVVYYKEGEKVNDKSMLQPPDYCLSTS